MQRAHCTLILSLLVLASLAWADITFDSQERIKFSFIDYGDVIVELDNNTPLHRDNILKFVDTSLYNGTIIHRREHWADDRGVIQGGGFVLSPKPGYYFAQLPEDFGTVPLEADQGGSNVHMTLGAARTSDPDSATSQWYFNIGDNSSAFDPSAQSDGYTVFGKVVEGRANLMNIWNLQPWQFDQDWFGWVPLSDAFDNTRAVTNEDFVRLESVTRMPQEISVNTSGAATLAAGSGAAGSVALYIDELNGSGTLTNDFSLLFHEELGNFGLTGDDMTFQTAALEEWWMMWDVDYVGDPDQDGMYTLTFVYDEDLLGTGVDENELAIYHRVDDEWIELAGVVDTDANTITVETDSFSPYAMGVTPEPTSLALLGGGALALLRRRKR
jgi:cyclophilin family peptidyl-prolyl cis-trans isomerase